MSVNNNKNCLCAGKDRFHFLGFDSVGGGASVEVVVEGEDPIVVSDVLTSDKRTFTVRYAPHEALAAALSINSIVTSPAGAQYVSGVTPLKGVTVTEVNLGWSFTQDGSSVDVYQEIDNVQVSPDTVKALNKDSLTLVHDSILADRTFTLFGNDLTGKPNSTVTDTAVLTFGNMIWKGENVFEDNDLALASMLTTLTAEIRLNENTSYNPSSLAGDVYTYIVIPVEYDSGSAFKDDASPVDVDPMQIHRSNFNVSNGVIPVACNVYISKQTALSGSQIRKL